MKLEEEHLALVETLYHGCLAKTREIVELKNLYVYGIKLMCKHLVKTRGKRDENDKLTAESQTDILASLDSQIKQFGKAYALLIEYNLRTKECTAKASKAFAKHCKKQLQQYINKL